MASVGYGVQIQLQPAFFRMNEYCWWCQEEDWHVGTQLYEM